MSLRRRWQRHAAAAEFVEEATVAGAFMSARNDIEGASLCHHYRASLHELVQSRVMLNGNESAMQRARAATPR